MPMICDQRCSLEPVLLVDLLSVGKDQLRSAVLPPPFPCDDIPFDDFWCEDCDLPASVEAFGEGACIYTALSDDNAWLKQSTLNVQSYIAEHPVEVDRFDSPIVFTRSPSPPLDMTTLCIITPLKSLFSISDYSNNSSPYDASEGTSYSPLSPSQVTESENLSSSQRLHSQLLLLGQESETVRCLFSRDDVRVSRHEDFLLLPMVGKAL